jgi:HSP20 family protein
MAHPADLFAEVFREPVVWSRRRTPASGETAFRLPLDAYMTEHEIVVQAAFPGVAPENVHLSVENETLSLTAELPDRLENVEYAFAERAHGRVSRQLALNVPVDLDKAEATFENGLLTLTLPKADVARPKSITVTGK